MFKEDLASICDKNGHPNLQFPFILFEYIDFDIHEVVFVKPF
jgi:hypothetical protein